jgi:hypothetical protein
MRWLLLIALLWASPSWGAVAADYSGTNYAENDAYAASLSLTTMTVGSGAERALYCALVVDQPISSPAITWNSVSMTQIASATDSASIWVYLFRLVNPASGNQTAAATWTTNSPSNLGCIAFSGVNQTTPEVSGDTTTATGSSTAPSTGAVTSTSNDATLGVAGAEDTGAASIAFTTPETQTASWRDTTSTTNETAGAGTYALGGTSNTHSFTLTESQTWAAIGIHIKGSIPTIVGCRLLQNGTDKRLLQNGTDGRIFQGGGDCELGGGPPAVVPVRMLMGVGL